MTISSSVGRIGNRYHVHVLLGTEEIVNESYASLEWAEASEQAGILIAQVLRGDK